ncbi:MAG: hypothetical protein GY810_23810 [Aureispira sp.]|nr:hypothetical protein [Aureispira sp.]
MNYRLAKKTAIAVAEENFEKQWGKEELGVFYSIEENFGWLFFLDTKSFVQKKDLYFSHVAIQIILVDKYKDKVIIIRDSNTIKNTETLVGMIKEYQKQNNYIDQIKNFKLYKRMEAKHMKMIMNPGLKVRWNIFCNKLLIFLKLRKK